MPPPGEWVYAWAWEDEAAGRVRARAFPGRDDGIDEDEATGAAALLLTDRLGRALNITQGAGSQILTAPQPEGWVEIGGRVFLERSTVRASGCPPQALSGNSSPSARKTAVFRANARLHSATIRCFSRSSARTPSSSSRYSRLKAAGLEISSKT